MSEFFKTRAQGTGFFAIVEEGCKFRFSSAGEDFYQNLTVNLDGAIGGQVRNVGKRWLGRIKGPVAQAVAASSTGACFRSGKMGCVAGHAGRTLLATKRAAASGWCGSMIKELG
jgi:hypothetical protein